MQDTIVTFYCICDDLLKALDHQDDGQTRYSSAEVMTVRGDDRAADCLCLLWR